MKTVRLQALILFVLLFMVLGCSKSASSDNSTTAENKKLCDGFATNSSGQQLSWQAHFPIIMHLDRNVPDLYMKSIKNAMNTWNEALGFIAFQMSESLSEFDKAGTDGKNVIFWWNSWTKKSANRQAVTLLSWIQAGVNEADMLINAQDFKYSTNPKENELDVESLVLHELGHVLGLDHNSIPDSVMNEHLPFGTMRRSLSSEDINHIKCEY